jgi:hypothetical protein
MSVAAAVAESSEMAGGGLVAAQPTKFNLVIARLPTSSA